MIWVFLQILRKLKHENIIEMLDAFETPQEFCVVTEFAQVFDLFAWPIFFKVSGCFAHQQLY